MFDKLTWESGRDLRRFLIANIGKDFDSIYSVLCSRFRGCEERYLLDEYIKAVVRSDVVSDKIVWVKEGVEEKPFYETKVARSKQSLDPLLSYPILFIDDEGILKCIHPMNNRKEAVEETCYKLDKSGFNWLVKRNDGSWWLFHYKNKYRRNAYWSLEKTGVGGLKESVKTSTSISELLALENRHHKVVRNYSYSGFRFPKKSIYNKWLCLRGNPGSIYQVGGNPEQFSRAPVVDGYINKIRRVSNDFAAKHIGVK